MEELSFLSFFGVGLCVLFLFALLLKYAMNHDGCIVTNDLYRDFIAKSSHIKGVKNWLRTHLVSFVFIDSSERPHQRKQSIELARTGGRVVVITTVTVTLATVDKTS